jgi:hypothetical protein
VGRSAGRGKENMQQDRIERYETILFGARGDNGVLGTLKDHSKRLDQLDDKIDSFRKEFDTYKYNERFKTCYGREALEKYIKERKEEQNMQLTREQFEASLQKMRHDMRLQVFAIIVMPIVMFILGKLFK